MLKKFTYSTKKQNRLSQTNKKGGQNFLAPICVLGKISNIQIEMMIEMEKMDVIQSNYSKKLR